MTSSTTQHRLAALLIGAIYRIVDGLFPVIQAIGRQPDRPWQQRARIADRFSRILQQLLALTARLRPATLSRNPIFPTTSPLPSPTTPILKIQHATAVQPRPAAPIRLLSARQFALRLASLLRQLDQLVAEVQAALPASIHRHLARARAIAGCNALHNPIAATTPHPSWESAG